MPTGLQCYPSVLERGSLTELAILSFHGFAIINLIKALSNNVMCNLCGNKKLLKLSPMLCTVSKGNKM